MFLTNIQTGTYAKSNSKSDSENSYTVSEKASIGEKILSAVTVVVNTTNIIGKAITNRYLYPGITTSKNYDVKNIKDTKNTTLSRSGYSIKVKQEFLEVGKTIKGVTYTATQPKGDKLKNKCIIFCSCNSDSFENWIKNPGIIRLLDEGAKVVAFDYRGYGYSKMKLSALRIGEKTIYQDAEDVYNYVRDKLSYKSNDILSFGFSLGGSVASHLADYANKDGGLGGAIFATPIKNFEYAANQLVHSKFFAKFGYVLNGSNLNTDKNLSNVKDKTLPIYFLSGDNATDWLSIEGTKVHENAKNVGFSNVSHNIVKNCEHWKIHNMFSNKNFDQYIDDISNYKK